uniref:Ig-like domain-containing protein n=1 Tax=Parascaris univalens TaxID=6257 RepID=A0A915BBJ9_PARUN
VEIQLVTACERSSDTPPCHISGVNMWPEFCLLVAIALVDGCEYNGTKHTNGEKWIVKSSFIMQCHINPNGSWKAEVIGCQTNLGKFMQEGENYTENETRYSCMRLPDGSMRLQRNFGPISALSCEGHAVGESWVVKTHFNKTCVSNGTRISNCLTESGIPVALNSKIVIGSVTYSCEQRPNGTVVWSRHSERALGKATPQKIVCNAGGVQKNPGDEWLEGGRFIKKCDEKGAILIEKCVLDDSSKMDLNTQLIRDGKIYTCKQFDNGTVWYRMEPNQQQ